MPGIWISLGSNINRDANIQGAVRALRRALGDLTLSRVYESRAVGFEGAPFYNLVAGADTRWSISELNRCFRRIEDAHGRIRSSEKFASRTLDIDLLTYGDQAVSEGEIDIPRPEITQYAFVLLPLSEVAPRERHPVLERTYAELWRDFDAVTQSLKPVNLDF